MPSNIKSAKDAMLHLYLLLLSQLVACLGHKLRTELQHLHNVATRFLLSSDVSEFRFQV